MPRQIFKNKSIATAGPLSGQLTVENLKRWTELRKGYYSEEFAHNVTHLLCTKEQFNKRVPRGCLHPIRSLHGELFFKDTNSGCSIVKEALKRGKSLHIVHCDWFEFSCVQEKRLPEKDFSMRNILAKQRAAQREQDRIEKGKKDGEKFVNTNLFHVYMDREFFPYQIDITRDEEESGAAGQKYTLYLWESDAKPHLYWFTAKFLKKKGDTQPNYHRPSSCSGKWREEMDLFMEFFHIKTGVPWEDRILRMKTMPSSYFQYTPPTCGKPVGRRLRFDYDYCCEINAELRGLPWPPAEFTETNEKDSDSLGSS